MGLADFKCDSWTDWGRGAYRASPDGRWAEPARAGGRRLGGRWPWNDRGQRGRRTERELEAARALTGRPIAVNVLLPFARRDWFVAAAGADAVITFWGTPKRRTPGAWLHQCGSVAEARSAHAAGADAVIVQGVEAGGHVRGATPALDLLEEVRSALPRDYPLLLAGGIAERGDVQRALDAGAVAAVAGTRFLLSEESRAHPRYKQRLVEAKRRSSPSCSAWAGRRPTACCAMRRPSAGWERYTRPRVKPRAQPPLGLRRALHPARYRSA